MLQQTEKVPIGRLFTNLQQRLARNTNDFNLTYQLARVHSMAYATNLSEVSVTKDEKTLVFGYPGSDSGVPRTVQTFKSPAARQTALQQLTNAIRLYERALLLLKQSTNLNEQRWMILPTQLGLAWCLDQSGQRIKALDAYRKTLKISWQMEVTGDFNINEWIQGIWSDVRSGKNPIHDRQRGYRGPGVCYSEEVIRYMLKLLDPVTDADEIAGLKQKQTTLSSMSRAITPILIPLTADTPLSELVNPYAAVKFDLDGSGVLHSWDWITPKAAWLVYDSDGRGQITSALQMFGNVSFWIFWHDGYAALSALDDNDDGVLRGEELQKLALWRDANSNGISEPGEVEPVAEYGIAAIACRGCVSSADGLWNPTGLTLTNGTTRATYDWISSAER